MTQEEKSILIKDLSARLPYEVKIETQTVPRKLFPMDLVCDELPRPYLRPMSSMTFEEEKDLDKAISFSYLGKEPYCEVELKQMTARIDWLNSHHFDYRGLIKKGLALEAPEGMYKID